MKNCVDPKHEGAETLELTEFYENPNTLDGRLSVCKVCHCRRAKEAVYRTRAARKERGLPVVPTAEERGEKENGYLERHLQKRTEEASRLSLSLQRSETERSGFHFKESDGFNSASYWVHAIDKYLRVGKPKPETSRC